jgi:NAD(P)-dependent dehydrogenase (short-subunit alcohol dehydrogenase family)
VPLCWFAQEGARIFAGDRDLNSADETAAHARTEGGECETAHADVVHESELKAAIEAAHERFGRIDILHYNVGISMAGGDAPVTEITEDAFDLISA